MAQGLGFIPHPLPPHLALEGPCHSTQCRYERMQQAEGTAAQGQRAGGVDRDGVQGGQQQGHDLDKGGWGERVAGE